jgi:hypothetical protein
MRITARKKFWEYFKSTKTIYGRTIKGSSDIIDLKGNRVFKTSDKFGVNWMGWMVLKSSGFGYWSISSVKLHPIYYIEGNGDKYNLNVIKDTLNKRSAKDYSDLDIKELFDIIPISFNGMVYINNELDQNQEYLNILRTRYNPEFDLNKVKESNIIVI